MYKKGVVVLVMGALLTVILAACTIENGASASSGPAVHMGLANFLQSSITIKKGEAVNLIDDATSEHIIVNGSWVGSTPHNAKEAGAPTVQQVTMEMIMPPLVHSIPQVPFMCIVLFIKE